MRRIESIIIVGGGSAGFMTGLALKAKLPAVAVTIVRSPEIGIIGVGEGSIPSLARFIHEYVGVPMPEFVRAVRPGSKFGTCFLWGPRPRFIFPFGPHMVTRPGGMARPIGYYMDHGDADSASVSSARIAANRTFELNPNGSITVGGDFAYHLENHRFVSFLEAKSRSAGVVVVDGTIRHVRSDGDNVSAVELGDGRSMAADLFVDCSGFKSLLLGQTLGEPFVSYKSTLPCDRAVVGGWDRPAGDPILAYTVAETMEAGWCWRIDHPDRTHRGYVYASDQITDESAERELRTKNPSIGPTRVVQFVSGRYQRAWVGNVVAVGNAGGFVEPLEATALGYLARRVTILCDLLLEAGQYISPPGSRLFNEAAAAEWDGLRGFLGLHYRFNTRLDTPFWRRCRAEIDLAGAAEMVEFYREFGPSARMGPAMVVRNYGFDAHGYHAILVGQSVPYARVHTPTSAELSIWDRGCRANLATAGRAATAEQALAAIAAG